MRPSAEFAGLLLAALVIAAAHPSLRSAEAARAQEFSPPTPTAARGEGISIVLARDYLNPWENVTANLSLQGAPSPTVLLITPNNRTINLSAYLREVDGTWILSFPLPLISPIPLGIYYLRAEVGELEAVANFTVDSILLSADWSCRWDVCTVAVSVESALTGRPVEANVSLVVVGPDNASMALTDVPVSGSTNVSFEPWMPGTYSLDLRAVDSRGIVGSTELLATVPSPKVELRIHLQRNAYAPGESISAWITANVSLEGVNVSLVTPGGRVIRLDPVYVNESTWLAEYPLTSVVELGRYDLLARGWRAGAVGIAEVPLWVDVLNVGLNASVGLAMVSVKAVAAGPLSGAGVNLTLTGPANFSASGTTEDGLAALTLPDLPPGNYSFSVLATWRGLSARAEGFVVLTPGAPSPNATLGIRLPEVVEFPSGEEVSVEVGLLLSGAPPGNASVEYALRGRGGEEALRGALSAPAPGNFTLPLGPLEPGNYTLEVSATLGGLRASESCVIAVRQPPGPCSPVMSVGGASLAAEGACISDARVVEPPEGPWGGRDNVVGLLLTLEGEPGFSAEIRLSGVEGVLVVVGTDGAPLRARYGVGGRTLSLSDGGSGDPDGRSDGKVSLIIVLELPPSQERGPSGRGGVGVSGIPAPEKAPKQPKKPALVKVLSEFEAKGEDGTWLVRWLEVRRPGSHRIGLKAKHVTVHWRGADFEVSGEEFWFDSAGMAIVEALLNGAPAAPPSRQVLLSPGKILVELANKSDGEWRRITVDLPPGAVVKEVLALGNETRKVEIWYQRGSTLVFYDDPNRYYYVIYGVPEWWDPDGPNSGDDWHYRVPITVPAGYQYQMVVVEVNFTDLLTDLNVSGTFDNNSVRVVDPSGSLVPKQEYIPTGRGTGIIKFLLPNDLTAQETFYVYFDILENGAKPVYNTLNTGVDLGDLSYWLYGQSPAGISSIIQASPRGPYTIDGGTLGSPPPNPRFIVDDGLPAVGNYSLVLGYRVNVSEDYTATGEDTWAAYEIAVPSGGGNLTFWFRVESWDSSYFDYLVVTIRDLAGNTLDTILVYNPNVGYSYGTFADSGWWIATDYDLTPYAGQTIRVNFTVHTYSDDWYKTWAYIDNLIWCNLSATVQADMVEGFGVNLTEPRGLQTFGPLKVVARVDAAPTGGVLARVYDPSGALVSSAALYDDGTHGDAVAGDGIFTNDNVYSISPGDRLGDWRIVVLANDSSASILSPSYDGLIHIPGRPDEVNYTDFFNVDELTFEVRANLSGIVFEDEWPLASGFSPGVDLPVSGVRVGLFLDNGDGSFDPLTDPLVRVTETSSAGGYSFLARNDTYWIAVDSRTVTSPRGLNAGRDWVETWAEGTYVVSWDGAAHTGSPDFGGRDPEVSDACSLEVVLYDGFETWAGWSDYGLGTVYQSDEQAYEGSFSLKKDSRNDPNGGYKPVGGTVGRGVILQGYTYRPSPWSGGARDRIGLEDPSFNGYTFTVDHLLGRIWIDRRDGGDPTRISARVSWDPPENEWYFWKMIFFANGTIAFQVYDLSGDLLAQVRATDTTYTSFDRIVVHGGYEYYVDELTLWRPGTRCEHVSLVSAGDYLGESLDFGFSFDVVVNTLDVDHDPSNPRVAQGTLRQFLLNANAISGGDRSWFVFMTPQNVQPDPEHSWWRIDVNPSLGQLPTITDAGTQVNGTVFTPSLSVNDANPGVYGPGGAVGSGPDGVPGTGDEFALPRYSLPEVAIYGQGLESDGLVIGAGPAKIANLSIYGFYSTYGSGGAIHVGSGATQVRIYGCFVGIRPDGRDPGTLGEERNVRLGILVEGDSTEILHSVISYNWGTGVHFTGSQVTSGLIQGCLIYSNGLKQVFDPTLPGGPDGTSVEGSAGGVVVRGNLIANNTCYGIDSWFSLGGMRVEENNITLNGWEPYQGEAGGVRLFGNHSVVSRNVIYSNYGGGVVVARTVPPPSWGSPGNALDNNLTQNSMFNNTGLGVDIDNTTLAGAGNPNGDHVTVNDGALNHGAPNLKVDYPVITFAAYNGTHVYVEGFVNSESAGSGSPEFAGATVEIFMVNNSQAGDNLDGNLYGSRYYGEGFIYLGSLVSDANGEFSGWIPVSSLPARLRPEAGSLLTGTTTLSAAGTSEFGPSARIGEVRLNVSVGKSLTPTAPCYYEVTLNVTNWNPTPAPGVRVYDIVPANMLIESPSPPYQGNSGGVYWWSVDLGPSGSPDSSQLITYTLRSSACGLVDYNLFEAFTLGVDPTESYLNISASEFVDIVLYPDSTYEVRRVWGFLTVSNPTGDVVSDIWIRLDSVGMEFYPDYPTPSDSPVSPPLHVPELRPGDYRRWRYEVDPGLLTPPVSALETVTPFTPACGESTNLTLRITLRFTDRLRNVSLLKPIPAWFTPGSVTSTGGSVSLSTDSIEWDIGDVDLGETIELVITGSARLTGAEQFPQGSLTFRRDDALLLHRIRGVHAVGPAALDVEKNLSEEGYSVRASFTNLARGLIYNLTEVCVWRGSPPPDGEPISCYAIGEAISPGETWVGPWRPDPLAKGVPEYYVTANFTVVPVVGGVQVPLLEAVNGTYLVKATLLEPNLTCEGARPPAPPELTFSKYAEPGVASLGDAVTFTITVRNVGGSGSGIIILEDELPEELTYVTGSSSVNGVSVEPETSGSILRWTLPPLPPGGEWILSFSATVSSLPVGSDIVYNVVLYGGEVVARAPVVIVRPPGPAPEVSPARPVELAKLSISKECSPAEVAIGDVVSCRIVLTNVGNGSAANLTLVDVLPVGLTFVEGSASPPPHQTAPGRLVWKVSELPPGRAFAAVFHAVVTAGAGGSLINVAYTQNYTATYRIGVRPPPTPGPVISKVGTYLGNQTIRYTVSVYVRGGPVDVVVVDRLPDAAALLPESVSTSGAEYASREPNKNALRIVLRLARAGSPATVTYLVKLPPGLAGDVINVAELPEFGLMASSVVRVPPTFLTAAMGGASALPMLAFLLLSLGLRRRRLVLYDSHSIRFTILTGGPGSLSGVRELALVTRTTTDDLLADSAVGPTLADLIRRGTVEVHDLEEGALVQALMLARTTGMSLESATNLIAAVTHGATAVVLSDLLAASVARELGLEVLLLSPTILEGEGELK